jgi:hypothetical protein
VPNRSTSPPRIPSTRWPAWRGFELVDDLAEIVTRVDAQVVVGSHTAGACRFERIERAFQGEVGETAIAVVRVRGRQIPPGGAELTVAVENRLRVAIDAGLEAQAHLGPQAEEIQLLEFESAGVLAAVPPEGETGIQSPDILRLHLEVDDAVVVSNWLNARIAQIAGGPQDAGGLGDGARLVELPLAKQQLIGNRRFARTDVQFIGQAEQRRILVEAADIEELQRVELNLADRCPARLQGRIVRDFGRARSIQARRARGQTGQHGGMIGSRVSHPGRRRACDHQSQANITYRTSAHPNLDVSAQTNPSPKYAERRRTREWRTS